MSHYKIAILTMFIIAMGGCVRYKTIILKAANEGPGCGVAIQVLDGDCITREAMEQEAEKTARAVDIALRNREQEVLKHTSAKP